MKEFRKFQILDESNKLLHKRSKEVTFPLSDEIKQDIKDALEYLRVSQNEDLADKYNLRAGMGLSFVQIGKPIRLFVIANKNEDSEEFEEHVIINPTITSQSEELIYVGEGEGCLSVNRNVEGIVPRFARINVEYQDMDGNIQNIRVREEIAVAFQHEIDHLNGILFVDRIDKKNPYKNKDQMREI